MGRAKRALVAFAFTLVSCSSQIVPAATPTINTALLRLYTTTAVLPLANELTSAYSKRFPMLAFDITSGNYEIGRASCRERGWVSGGAAPFKQKTAYEIFT